MPAKIEAIDQKNATLKLALRAASGYSADSQYQISPNQWGRIVAIAEDGEQAKAMKAADDMLKALKLADTNSKEPADEPWRVVVRAAIANATGAAA